MSFRSLCLFGLVFSGTAVAVEIAGVELPNQWTLDGQPLVLNGAGVREYGTLSVDVYVAALYLSARQAFAQAVLDSAGPKVLHMVFLRDVDRADTLKAWEYYLQANCPPPCVWPAKEVESFKRLVPVTLEADRQTYIFRSQGVELLVNGKPVGRVEGRHFAHLLLATWIGEVPTTPALRKALLGSTQ